MLIAMSFVMNNHFIHILRNNIKIDIRESQIEDVLVNAPALFKQLLGLTDEPRLIARQMILPSKRIDLKWDILNKELRWL